MEMPKRVMVGLDFTQLDQTVIEYADFICKFLKPEKVYFIHILENLDVPEEIRAEIYGTDEPYDEYLRSEMEKKTNGLFKEFQPSDIEFLVVEGSPLPQMLHWSKIKEVDLLVLGRNNSESGGAFSTRLTRRANCSTLIVPYQSSLVMDNILVCNDFSKNAELAFQNAIEFSKQSGFSTIYSQHLYHVPTGYHKSGKSYEEIAKIMKKHEMKKYEQFLQKLDLQGTSITPIFTLDQKSDPASIIYKTAESMQSKLVILGSKGMTYAASIFLGGFAENLIRVDTNIPLLVVKQKDEILGIFEALRKI